MGCIEKRNISEWKDHHSKPKGSLTKECEIIEKRFFLSVSYIYHNVTVQNGQWRNLATFLWITFHIIFEFSLQEILSKPLHC
jgi:hypothetical protein